MPNETDPSDSFCPLHPRWMLLLSVRAQWAHSSRHTQCVAWFHALALVRSLARQHFLQSRVLQVRIGVRARRSAVRDSEHGVGR